MKETKCCRLITLLLSAVVVIASGCSRCEKGEIRGPEDVRGCAVPIGDLGMMDAAEEYVENIIHLRDYSCRLDYGNSEWAEIVSKDDSLFLRDRMTMLGCRDYQDVVCRYKEVGGGEFRVFVDRCTGEIITVYTE